MIAEPDDIPTVQIALQDPYNALLKCKIAHESDDARNSKRNNAIAAAAYAITYAFDHDHHAWGRAVIEINQAGLVKPKIRRDKHRNLIREKLFLSYSEVARSSVTIKVTR